MVSVFDGVFKKNSGLKRNEHILKRLGFVFLAFHMLMGVSLTACSKNESALLPENEAFVRCYVDIMIVHAAYETLSDSLQKQSFNKVDSLNLVFQKHQTTKDKFYNDLKTLKENEETWQKILKAALETMENKRRNL